MTKSDSKKEKYNLFDPMNPGGSMATNSDKERPGGARQTDVVIPVIGKTGSGKSTFINAIPCNEKMDVGHSLFSCTKTVQVAIANPEFVAQIRPELGDRRVVLVDTPGFGDTYRDDLDVLKEITSWLASSYHYGQKLAGVVYLHAVDEARLGRDGSDHLEVFEALCGDEAFKSVVLGTTKWERTTVEEESLQQDRERELQEAPWKRMIERHSRVMRFMNDEPSAREILNAILSQFLDQPEDEVLKIQKELVDKLKDILETGAGQKLSNFIKREGKVTDKLNKLDRMDRDSADFKKLPFWRRVLLLLGQ